MFTTRSLLQSLLSCALLLGLATWPAAAKRTMVPAKRAVTLQTRDLWKRDLTPRGSVQLNYGPSTYHPPSAFVSFVAHDDRPILLLEDMDHLLDNVRCTQVSESSAASVMELSFAFEDAFVDALELWTELGAFALVTAHPTCNQDDERGAWMIDSVQGDILAHTITLTTRPVEWQHFGKSCHVKYDYNGRNTVDVSDQLNLQRRQTVVDDNTYSIGVAPDLSRFPLYPPNATLAPNASADGLDGLNLQLTCVDCGLTFNVSIGVDFEIVLSNATCVPSPTQACFGLTRADTNFTIDELELSANLEVFLGGQINKAGNYSVLRIPIEPGFEFGTVVEIGPAVGLELLWSFDAQGALNFTYGASAQAISGAFASFSLVNSSGAFDPTTGQTGWGNTGVTQNPFRLNAGALNTTTTVALAPYAEVEFTIMDVGALARALFAIPGVDIDADLLTNVDRQCNPLGPESFESFSAAIALSAGLDLYGVAHFELDTGLFPLDLGFPTTDDFTLFDKQIPLLPASNNKTDCFVIVDDNNSTSSTLTGVPASTGTLFSAASAVPTWNISGIESYFSAHSSLPPNVNYTQMAQATSVPSVIAQAVSATVTATSVAPSSTGFSSGGGSSSAASPKVSVPFFSTAFVVTLAVVVGSLL